MMGAPFNAEPLVNRALAVVQARRAQRLAEGFEGAGAFQSFECAGRLLVLAGGFDPEALADILDRLAPPMVRFDVRPAEAPAKRKGITPLAAGVTGRRWEVM